MPNTVQRRLAHGNGGVFADAPQRVRQADGYGGFAFAGGGGVDGGYQNQFAVFFRQRENVGGGDFGFVFAVVF